MSTAPFVMNKFSQKAQEQIRTKQEGGGPARNRMSRPPKDFAALYEGAKHVSTEGWLGIPCAAFRAALVTTCKMAGYPMTRAKMSIFVLADGYEEDGTALVKITHGKAEPFESWGRND